LIVDSAIAITTGAFKGWTDKLHQIDFWYLPTEKIEDYLSMDGTQWIMEAVKDNQYHLVTRWSPPIERYGNVRSLRKYLVSLSTLSKEETKYLY
jgi:hypothetical protein